MPIETVPKRSNETFETPLPWFRMYSEWAFDPKVQMMTEQDQRRLVMLFCLRGSETLETLHETEIAFYMRITETELAATKKTFLRQGFIDSNWNIVRWEARQSRQESSTERVRRYRQRQKELKETLGTLQKPFHETKAKRGNVIEESRGEKSREEEKRVIPGAREETAVSSAFSPETASPAPQGGVAESSDIAQHGSFEDEAQVFDAEQETRQPALPTPISVRVPDTTQDPEPSEPGSSASTGGLNGEVSAFERERRERIKAAKAREHRAQLDWPIGIDREESLREMLMLYPVPKVGSQVKVEAMDAIDRVAVERGAGHWDALQWLREKVIRYGEVRTSRWEAAVNWFNNESYNHTETQWRNGNDKDAEDGNERIAALRRKSEQGGGDRAGDGGPDGRLGKKPSAEDMQALRRESYGSRLKPLVERLH